jgi:hypothetical protein
MMQTLGVNPDLPEGIMAVSAKNNLTLKETNDTQKQKVSKKKKKLSETEKRLMNR